MILKILGILDILAAVFFWLGGMFHVIPGGIITILATYLLVKGLIFVISDHIASVMDILIAGAMFLSLAVDLPRVIVFIVTLLLLQKGIFSLAA